MKISYEIGKETAERVSGSAKDKNDRNASLILANNAGGYFSLADVPLSRYNGLFFMNGFRMFKTVENIELVNNENTGGGKAEDMGVKYRETDEIIYNLLEVKRKKGDIVEGFFMPHNLNSLVYELNKKSDVAVYFDVKESYNNDEWGRHYEVSEEKGSIIIKFTKKKEGQKDGQAEFTVYTAIRPDVMEYEKTGQWVKREYGLDRERDSMPYERYVYSAIRLSTGKMVVSCSMDRDKAIKEAEFVYKNLKGIKNKAKKFIKAMSVGANRAGRINNRIKNSELNIAYSCALNSLNSLYLKAEHTRGILAGLPWFFQFWNRDELISLKALILAGKSKEAKRILFSQLNGIKTNGRMLSSYPGGSAESADAAGWLFRRFLDLTEQGGLTKKEKERVRDKLESCISNILKNYSKGGLIHSNKKESWMDSIGREGFNIEVQALQLCMYRLLNKLGGGKFSAYLEERMKKDVRKNFWNSKVLLDNLNPDNPNNLSRKDIRPNIFIAAYAYPELLTKGEWTRCFERALPCLWLEWGGLSSIDKNSPAFTAQHTGENSRSYHNGDSWFWVNNIAAIVMYRTNRLRFKEYIVKILEASTKEILWLGAIGRASELSSAGSLKSEGCWLQAWSNATYVELINEIFKKDAIKKSG